MPKIIVVERPGPGEEETDDRGNCPYKGQGYRHSGLEDVFLYDERDCDHPNGPDKCPDPDTFPETCPLKDREELKKEIIKKYFSRRVIYVKCCPAETEEVIEREEAIRIAFNECDFVAMAKKEG